jgi:hypothetical protein
MTEREKLIEAMASAMYSAEFDGDYSTRGEELKILYREQATAALAAIEASGAVVVPVEATPAIHQAMAAAIRQEWKEGGLSDEQAIAGFAAMVAASPFAKGSTDDK